MGRPSLVAPTKTLRRWGGKSTNSEKTLPVGALTSVRISLTVIGSKKRGQTISSESFRSFGLLVGDYAAMCHHAIEKVFQLAAATFSKKAGPDSFTVNLEKLISLTNKLGGSDVGLDCCAALQKTSSNSPNNTQDSPRGSRDRCFIQPHICIVQICGFST